MKNRQFVGRMREIEEAADLVLQVGKEKQFKLWPSQQLTDLDLLCPKRVARAFGITFTEIKDTGS